MPVRLDPSLQRITVTNMGLGLVLFGLVFASFGAFFIFNLLTSDLVQVNGRLGEPSDAWFPGVFVLIGLLIAFFRRRRVIDLRLKRVAHAWTFLAVPVWKKHRDIAGAAHVGVSREVRQSKNSSYTVFPVRLFVGGDPVEIVTPRNALAARREAERIAKFARVPMHDASEGDTHVRDWNALDRSVLETADVPSVRPRAPSSSAVIVLPADRGTRLQVPMARQLVLLGALAAAFVLVTTGGFWLFLWSPNLDATRSVGHLVFKYLPLLLPAFALFTFVVGAATNGLFGAVIEVSPDGVRLRHPIGSRFIATADLEELRDLQAQRGGALLARSDERELRLGHGLAAEDRDYLRAMILYFLSGRR